MPRATFWYPNAEDELALLVLLAPNALLLKPDATLSLPNAAAPPAVAKLLMPQALAPAGTASLGSSVPGVVSQTSPALAPAAASIKDRAMAADRVRGRRGLVMAWLRCVVVIRHQAFAERAPKVPGHATERPPGTRPVPRRRPSTGRPPA